MTFAPLTEQHGSGLDWSDDSEDDNAILLLGESLLQVAEHEFGHERRAPKEIAAVQIPVQPRNTPLSISADTPDVRMGGAATLASALVILQGEV